YFINGPVLVVGSLFGRATRHANASRRTAIYKCRHSRPRQEVKPRHLRRGEAVIAPDGAGDHDPFGRKTQRPYWTAMWRTRVRNPIAAGTINLIVTPSFSPSANIRRKARAE